MREHGTPWGRADSPHLALVVGYDIGPFVLAHPCPPSSAVTSDMWLVNPVPLLSPLPFPLHLPSVLDFRSLTSALVVSRKR